MTNAAGSQGKKLCPMQLVIKREDVPDAAGSQGKKLCLMQLVVKEESCARCSW